FQQQSHLSISDELLNFFLEESSTTGAGGDEATRQRVRAAARGKVGFDPFDESPIKRRGEDYMYARTPQGTPRGTPVREFSPMPGNMPGIRSRENTPESPVQAKRSPVVVGGSTGKKGMKGSAMFMDDAVRRGSPLSKGSVVREDDVVESREGADGSDTGGRSKREDRE
ncbi:RanGTP-binding protein, partial [Aspergillus sclerotialis]